MALLIDNAKFENTDVTTSCYVRLQYQALKNGRTALVWLFPYISHTGYTENKEIHTNLPKTLNITVGVDEQQNLDVIHTHTKTALEAAGYNVIIDLT